MNSLSALPTSPSNRIAASPPRPAPGHPGGKRLLDRRKDASIRCLMAGPAPHRHRIFAGSIDDVLARLPETAAAPPRQRRRRAARSFADPAVRKLGVVAREITLLRGTGNGWRSKAAAASVALRKLVDAARRTGEDTDRVRLGTGSGPIVHVCHGRQQAALRRCDPRVVRGRSGPFRKLIAEWPAGCA